MTDQESRDINRDAIAIASETLGRDLLKGLLDEVRTLPDAWAKLNEVQQTQCIDRLKNVIRDSTGEVIRILLRGDTAAVVADLNKIVIANGIQAIMTIDKSSSQRHMLMDAVGRRLVVVIDDSDRWLSRMDEIKAKANQYELFDQSRNYDPSQDQPGYRRDQDDHLNIDRDPPASGPILFGILISGSEFGTDDDIPSGDDETVDQARIERRMLQEELAEMGCPIDLGSIVSWSVPQIEATRLWMNAYNSTPKGDLCSVPRPLWLPAPWLPAPPKMNGAENDLIPDEG